MRVRGYRLSRAAMNYFLVRKGQTRIGARSVRGISGASAACPITPLSRPQMPPRIATGCGDGAGGRRGLAAYDEPSPGPGRLNRKVAPWGTFAVAHIRPPCASMIERQIDSPMPMPPGLVV